MPCASSAIFLDQPSTTDHSRTPVQGSLFQYLVVVLDLSFASLAVNAITLVVTTIAGNVLGEQRPSTRQYFAIALILAGTFLTS